ncbi:MAG: hypothetical protein JNK64_26305 [Myxococcales bacterium]|nr:hypothetical protein [Myxococcales bacterium]
MNFLAPRLDVAVGLPWFSSHLTADVGISARAAVPYATNAERTTYEYRAIWESDGKVGSEFDFIDALEIGAAIKYIF